MSFTVGVASIALAQIAASVTPSAVALLAISIAGGLVGSLIAARIFHLYPIDAMIALGCNFATLGGSGAISVLGASHRMALMPFATITCRIGGAAMLVLYSSLATFMLA